MTPRFIRVFLEAKEMPSREVSGYQTPDTSFLETKIITSVLSEFRRRQLQDNQALRPLRHGCNLTDAMSSASLLGQIKLSIICNENVSNVFNNIIPRECDSSDQANFFHCSVVQIGMLMEHLTPHKL